MLTHYKELGHRSGIEFLGVLLISVISRRLPSITPLSASLGDPEHADGANAVGGDEFGPTREWQHILPSSMAVNGWLYENRAKWILHAIIF
jgi:hypothetical protein